MLKLRILIIGAHPDDCDGGCGGIALKYIKEGCTVQFVSVTDGSAGHQSYKREALAKIRKSEAQASAAVGGLTYLVLDNPDGRLEVNLNTRDELLRIIRNFAPDIIITHRPNDYHPDHRYTSQLVQDNSYLIMIPNVCPDTPALKFQPAIFYMSDSFKRPYSFSPNVAVSIDDVIDRKLEMVSCHKSQFFDFLPWIDRLQKGIPEDYDDSKYAYDCVNGSDRRSADRFRNLLIARYGEQRGSAVEYAEAYEMSEYGSQISEEEINDYFPL
ncbi:MAG: PIG-L deacetylase family protein [Oscillospiraceae bacterium]|nr:PIG-L deacetylase family protein [Oscillospiraceae bacterium]